MIAHLIDSLRETDLRPTEPGAMSRALAATRTAHADWQFERDIAAVMAALGRLSDRRLALIGVRREALFETVAEMITRAEVDRERAAELVSLADGQSGHDRRAAGTEAGHSSSTAGQAA